MLYVYSKHTSEVVLTKQMLVLTNGNCIKIILNLPSTSPVFRISIVLASLECTLSEWYFKPFELLNDFVQFLQRYGLNCRSLNGCIGG